MKSRYATDSNRAIPVKKRTLGAFDYLIIVFQNVGYYYRKKPVRDGIQAPEFYTLPVRFVKKHHSRKGKGWELFTTKNLDIRRYKNEAGFEQIAEDLGIPYPAKST